MTKDTSSYLGDVLIVRRGKKFQASRTDDIPNNHLTRVRGITGVKSVRRFRPKVSPTSLRTGLTWG